MKYERFADLARARTLQIIFNDVKVLVDDDELTMSAKSDLGGALKNCKTVLKDLHTTIDSFTELDGSNSTSKRLPRRVWKRLKWDSHGLMGYVLA